MKVDTGFPTRKYKIPHPKNYAKMFINKCSCQNPELKLSFVKKTYKLTCQDCDSVVGRFELHGTYKAGEDELQRFISAVRQRYGDEQWKQ